MSGLPYLVSCITREGGLTVFDACPAKAIHEDFATIDAFRLVIAAPGLPVPRIEGLGDVQVALLRHQIVP
jgi:hypothetical protein